MANKQFKIGQKWRRRDDIVVVITDVANKNLPMRTSDGHYHDKDGFLNGSQGRPEDLVELILDEPPAKPKYEKCEGCGHVRGYCTLGHKCNCGAYYKPLTEDVPPVKAEPKPLFHVGQEGVTTRDGRKVRILCVDRKCHQPIVAMIGDGDSVFTFCSDGRRLVTTKSGEDLIPPPPPKQYVYINVYNESSLNTIHESREAADEVAAFGRTSCIKVELPQGRWGK